MNIKKFLFSICLSCGVLANDAFARDELKLFASPVTENVYSIISPSFGLPTTENKGWNSNSYFVVTEIGVLVFDTGSSKLIGEAIRKAIRAVTDKPVRWVVNSHSHADHWLGNAPFEREGIEIISSEIALAMMKNDADFVVKAFSEMTEGATDGTEAVYPTKLLVKDKNASMGGLKVEFIFSKSAHSPGDILLWLPEQKVILGGDVLNSEWMPIITRHTDVPNLIATLKKVAALKPAFVLPGHGETTSKDSLSRDVRLLESLWQAVNVGHVKGDGIDKITRKLNAQLAEEFRPLYNDFDAKIGEQVEEIMIALQNKKQR